MVTYTQIGERGGKRKKGPVLGLLAHSVGKGAWDIAPLMSILKKKKEKRRAFCLCHLGAHSNEREESQPRFGQVEEKGRKGASGPAVSLLPERGSTR